MATLIIKVGCNEPNTYKHHSLLSQHGDVIELLRDGIDPGKKVLAHYLCISVDLSHLTDGQFASLRHLLISDIRENEHQYQCEECDYIFESEYSPSTCPTCRSDAIKSLVRMITKRQHRIEIPDLSFISVGTNAAINDMAGIKNNIKPQVYVYRQGTFGGAKLTESDKAQIAAYQKTLENSFDMKNINKPNNVVSYPDIETALQDKLDG